MRMFGKPEPLALARPITTVESEVTGLSGRGGWVVRVGALGDTLLESERYGSTWGPGSEMVRRLEAHWASRRVPPKRIEKERSMRVMCEVVRFEKSPMNKRHRVDRLSCGHRVVALWGDPKRKSRHCATCAKELR